MVLHSAFCFTLLFVMCYRVSDLAGDNFTNGVRDWISDMVWVCYSSSSTCLVFVAALLGLLSLAVLCHLLLWAHITPKGVVLSPQRGSFYSPKGVVSSFLKVGIKPS